MDGRSKRTITRPARYQTTSSDEAPTKRTMDSTKVQNIGTIEDDINDLRNIVEKDPSQDNVHGTENQYTPCVDTLAQTRAHVQYLPATCSQYTLLQTPLHAEQYGTYSSPLEMERSTSNIHTTAYVHNEAHQRSMRTNVEPLHNLDNR